MTSKTLGKRKGMSSAFGAGPHAQFKKPMQSRKYKGIARIKGGIKPKAGAQELNFVDVTHAGLVCDTTGTVTLLNGVAQGDDYTNRQGRQVTFKSIQLRGSLRPDDPTNQSMHIGRLMLVWDNATNSAGAVPAITDILVSSSSRAFPLVTNANRFTILWDSYYASGRTANTATQAVTAGPIGPYVINVYKKLNVVTQYSGTSNTISNIQNGALLLVTVGDIATGASDTMKFSGFSRARFLEE